MKTISKILAFVITLTLTITIFCAFGMNTSAATVESGTCGDNLVWTLDDEGTLTISGTGSMKNYYYAYYDIREFAPWISLSDNIKNVYISEGVETIGISAFLSCNNLTNITIPESIESIGYNAFNGCTSLTSITISDNVTFIDEQAFSNCSKLVVLCNKDSKAQYYCNKNSIAYVLLDDESDRYIKGSVDAKLTWSIDKLQRTLAISCNSEMPSDATPWSRYSQYFLTATIEEGCTSISDGAFAYCTSLTSITIPENVTYIGESAFRDCINISKINWNAKNVENHYGEYSRVFKDVGTNTGGVEVVFGNSVNRIPGYLFSNYYLRYDDYSDIIIKSITIGNSVTSIGGHAFYRCSGPTNVKFAANSKLTHIDKYAFHNFFGLSNITIPDSVTDIDEYAFYDCPNLTIVKFGTTSKLTNICKSAFENCEKLTSNNLPNGVKSIGNNAFKNCTSLKSITIPDSVMSIDEAAFLYCTSLTSVIISDGVTSIGEDAFSHCSSLTKIIIPDSITSVGDNAFNSCKNLASVSFGVNSKLSIIGSGAFFDCTSLKSMVIPNSVTSIGKGALDGCSSINSITLPFVGDKIHKATDTYQYPFGYIFGATQYTDETKQYYIGSSLDSIEFSYYCIPSSLKSVTITGNTIPYGAFYNCSGITNITLGKNVKDIGNNAFYNCASLTSIIIPDGVTSIGTSAFSGCSSLATVTLGKGLTDFENIKSSGVLSSSKLKTINLTAGNTAFATVDGVLFSKDLSTIYLYPREKTGTEYTVPAGVKRVYKNCFSGSKLTKINMPNGLQNIGDSAFSSCSSLRSVTIPKAVTYIGNSAFAGDSIDDIYYGGSSSDKDKITVGSSNSPLQSAIWHYNTVIVDKPAVPDKPATHTHSYKSSVTTKATCTKAGVMTYVCTCGNSYTKAIPATGHKDANADKVCDVCGAKITTLNAKINVASAKSVDYKAQVTIKATASGVPAGYSLAMYVNGKQVAKGSNTEVTYTVGQATSDINYTVKVIDAKGNVQKDSTNKDLAKDGGKITVNSSFFAKIIAFFKSLFGSLSKVEVKP